MFFSTLKIAQKLDICSIVDFLLYKNIFRADFSSQKLYLLLFEQWMLHLNLFQKSKQNCAAKHEFFAKSWTKKIWPRDDFHFLVKTVLIS